jgi:hypothetical protein
MHIETQFEKAQGIAYMLGQRAVRTISIKEFKKIIDRFAGSSGKTYRDYRSLMIRWDYIRASRNCFIILGKCRTAEQEIIKSAEEDDIKRDKEIWVQQMEQKARQTQAHKCTDRDEDGYCKECGKHILDKSNK